MNLLLRPRTRVVESDPSRSYRIGLGGQPSSTRHQPSPAKQRDREVLTRVNASNEMEKQQTGISSLPSSGDSVRGRRPYPRAQHSTASRPWPAGGGAARAPQAPRQEEATGSRKGGRRNPTPDRTR